MPELPEVETIVRQINKEVCNRKITDFLCFSKEILKNTSPLEFKNKTKNKKILKAERKGKNILIYLDNNLIILIHLKLTGHLLLGNYQLKNNELVPQEDLLKDPNNRFIRLAFKLDNNKYLALSDLRKFAKVLLLRKEDLTKEISSLGIDPLAEDFSLDKLKQILFQKRGIIKKFLMNQKYISGVGNIYASEILFEAKIHPLKKIESLKKEEIENLYLAIKKVLKKAIQYQGTSAQDETYRNIYGEKGGYTRFLKVYQRKKCPICSGDIKRIRIDNRSTFYCPNCQKL